QGAGRSRMEDTESLGQGFPRPPADQRAWSAGGIQVCRRKPGQGRPRRPPRHLSLLGCMVAARPITCGRVAAWWDIPVEGQPCCGAALLWGSPVVRQPCCEAALLWEPPWRRASYLNNPEPNIKATCLKELAAMAAPTAPGPGLPEDQLAGFGV